VRPPAESRGGSGLEGRRRASGEIKPGERGDRMRGCGGQQGRRRRRREREREPDALPQLKLAVRERRVRWRTTLHRASNGELSETS
jgi:hypothetical protein